MIKIVKAATNLQLRFDKYGVRTIRLGAEGGENVEYPTPHITFEAATVSKFVPSEIQAKIKIAASISREELIKEIRLSFKPDNDYALLLQWQSVERGNNIENMNKHTLSGIFFDGSPYQVITETQLTRKTLLELIGKLMDRM